MAFTNASSPIVVTLSGMVIEVSEVSPENAPSPIDSSTLSASKVIEVSEVAFRNANLPIEVTLFGMAIEVSEVASRNA